MLRSEIVRGAADVRVLSARESALREVTERVEVVRGSGVDLEADREEGDREDAEESLLRASRDEPGCAGVIVGTPLEVVRVGVRVERGSEELELVPPEERLVVPLDRVTPPDERLLLPLDRLIPPEDGVLPLDRLTPPDERLLLPLDRLTPPDERLLPLDRLIPPEDGVLPLDRLTPPDERLLLPLDRLTPPDERLLLPLERLTPPEERLLLPVERLTPPEDRLVPPLERLTPPDEPPEEPPREARWASTRFTGAANKSTASTANKKKLIRLGVSISDLRRLTRGMKKAPPADCSANKGAPSP